MSEISTNATVRSTSVRSRRDQRTQRYREIASILWDERVLSLFRDTEVPDYAPDGATLEEVADDAPELEGRRAPREVRVRRALERLGPTYVKLGQLLATRRDFDLAGARHSARKAEERRSRPALRGHAAGDHDRARRRRR